MGLILTQIASDNFTRSNENPLSGGGNWSALGGASTYPLKLLSDACICSDGSGNTNGSLYTGATFSNNQYSEVTVVDPTGTEYCGAVPILQGLTSALTCYTCRIYSSSTTWLFEKLVNGTLVDYVAFSGCLAVTNGMVLGLYQSGNIITFTQNGTVYGSYVDTQVGSHPVLSGGYPGIFNSTDAAISATSDAASNFTAGNVSGAPVQKAFLDYYGNTNNSLAFPSVCGTGNSILVIAMNCYSGVGLMTMSDNESNSYTQLDSDLVPSGVNNAIQVWLATNIASGTQTITVDGASGTTFMAIGIWELPGIWAKDVQTIGAESGSSPNYTLGPLTTNYADFCVESMGATASNTISTSSPWTQETLTGGRTDAFCFGEYLQSSAGSITANFSVTSPSYPHAYIGAFYQVTSSGIPGALSMMGCGAS